MEEYLIKKLLSKSTEAFIMSLEIYNKPTIAYRVEGFSFFICNAWELMLKAKMIQEFGNDSIYYKDNKDRSLNLRNCIKKIFTNNKDPLRLNLEKINDLRDVSTHYITEEYEQIYIPLFQSCVINYSNKLLEFFDIDITTKVAQNFINLSVNIKEFDMKDIEARYSKEIAEKILRTKEQIWKESEEQNEKFSINIQHNYYITKNKNKAVVEFRVSKDAEDAICIVKQIQDPNNTHPYSTKNCLEAINKELQKQNIPFTDLKNRHKFNNYHFMLFTKFYNLKENTEYCYSHKIGNKTHCTYSNKTIDLIIREIKNNPTDIIAHLKNSTKKES